MKADPATQMQRKFARVKRSAEILDVSERTIWRLIKDGHLCAAKVGGSTLIPLTGPGSIEELTAPKQAA